MLGGAVLNASTFIGGSYLAKYLSGTKTDQERRRHDKALEKYQRDYAKYQENRQKLLDWQEQNRHEDAIALRNFENTDEALKLYNKLHPDENMQINTPEEILVREIIKDEKSYFSYVTYEEEEY